MQNKILIPILKTIIGAICTIGLPFWQPSACLPSHYFHHFNNPIFPTENLVKILREKAYRGIIITECSFNSNHFENTPKA